MSTTTPKKKDAFVITKFGDVGTGRWFAAGAIEQISEGEFANYAAAGLVRAPTADERKAGKLNETA